ncbi:aflatoxin regulatory protein-domain-containing protein [Talaromyces proteolyticus]|uniref:Aflatoxin regulatory protein-domain-containing protein n=1 Tax=Talaromyces proteolyticus TaxID=1131652 RepID=A0AAD4Q0P0_9EURO|nr:aflatoxin regulatory protein-domain-containing protein [Talaromyces proteolyticus]KAH8701044.1 aflatoxin regulatory protein-domain-containing protein [Talaromyces proteolyticus]
MQDSIPNIPIQRASPCSFVTTTHQKSAATTSKLRDSCHACAMSKVRCPKEKPTCSRCEKRKIPCEYFITKRPGRKRENGHSYNNATTMANLIAVPSSSASSLSDVRGTHVSTSSSTSLSLPDLTPPSPGNNVSSSSTEFPSYIDVFADLMMPIDPSLSPQLSNHLNDQLTTPINFAELESSLESHLSNFTQGSHDIAELLTSDDMDIEPGPTDSRTSSIGYAIPSKPPFLSLGAKLHPTQSSENSNGGTFEPGSTCRCMIQVLELMSKLFLPESPISASSSTRPGDDRTLSTSTAQSSSNNISTQTLIAQNKQSIESINNILQCQCTETGYRITLLSMIVFKILERYALAARQQPREASFEVIGSVFSTTLSDSRRKSSAANDQMEPYIDYSKSSDDESTRRMTAQLILSELHRVQGLVNKLTQRLNARETLGKNSGFERNYSQIMPSKDGGKDISGFSAATLDKMKTDLRKCLATLSSEIINTLRQS